MHIVKVQIERFVDDHQPGFVECSLVDAEGNRHVFIEKVPVVSSEDLRSDTMYPRPGTIACEIESEGEDAAIGKLVTISTERPWGVESSENKARFTVWASQVTTK